MADWQRDKKSIINYPPEYLHTFDVMYYEWIDNLCFTIDPHECVDNAEEYIDIAKEKFLADGWDGDGRVELMWLPPFVFGGKPTQEFTKGVVIWHVKQQEDGISWLLLPYGLAEYYSYDYSRGITLRL